MSTRIDGPSIVTDDLGSADATFEQFVSHLPPNECRYAIYDMRFTTSDGRPGAKLVLITW
jgi:cofilin